MDILLLFNEKPKNTTKDFVIQVAKEFEFSVDKERYNVLFHEIDSKLMQILPICSRWSTTQLFIDNKEFNPQLVSEIFNCYNKIECNGICRLMVRSGIFDYYSFYYIIKRITRPEYTYSSDPDSWQRLDNLIMDSKFIKKIDENTLLIDKEMLKNKLFEDIELPIKICKLTNRDKIIKAIDSIPEKIQRYSKWDDKSQSRNETTDPPKYVGLTNNQKERYKEVAELIAPIFAREIAKELTKLFEESNKTIEKEQK